MLNLRVGVHHGPWRLGRWVDDGGPALSLQTVWGGGLGSGAKASATGPLVRTMAVWGLARRRSVSAGRSVMRTSALLALLLGGCAHVAIDEAFVFHPQPMDREGAGEILRWQNVLTEPSDWVIDYDVNGEKGRASGSKASFVRYDVQHGYFGEGARRIAYSLIAAGDRSRPLIVHCGGNAADRRRSGVPYAVKALPFGDVLLFDYPGYGDSAGAPSAESFEHMVERLSPFAEETADGRPIVFWGHSLGGFVCAELAARNRQTRGVILEASARSARAVADAMKPWWLRPFLDVRIAESLAAYDNAAAAAKAGAPVLVLGAGQDRTLRAPLSRGLAKALRRAGADVTYREFPEANHVSIPQAEGFDETVARFFARVDDNRGFIAADGSLR